MNIPFENDGNGKLNPSMLTTLLGGIEGLSMLKKLQALNSDESEDTTEDTPCRRITKEELLKMIEAKKA